MQHQTPDQIRYFDERVSVITEQVVSGADRFRDVLEDVDAWKDQASFPSFSEISETLTTIVRRANQAIETLNSMEIPDVSDLPYRGNHCTDSSDLNEQIVRLTNVAAWLIAERDVIIVRIEKLLHPAWQNEPSF